VATHLKCVGIWSDAIITNFLLILIVKKVRKFDGVIRRKNVASFWATLHMKEHRYWKTDRKTDMHRNTR